MSGEGAGEGMMGDGWGTGGRDDGWESAWDGWVAGCLWM